MTPTSPLHRHALRIVAVLAFAGYAAIMAPLLRQDTQLATLGDTLQLKQREVDAQLEHNGREVKTAKKRPDDVAFLREERRILSTQGLQITREVENWQARRSLWSQIYWSVFAFAHLVVLPLGLWALAAASSQATVSRSRPATTPRKRAPRTPRNSPPKLIEGAGPP